MLWSDICEDAVTADRYLQQVINKGVFRQELFKSLKVRDADSINPEQTLLIFPEAKRLTTGLRYWLKDLIDSGLTVVAIAVTNPAKDIFLNLIEIEIANPSEVKIREIMRKEAERYYLTWSDAEEETAQHTQYINQDLRINAIGSAVTALK